MEAVLTLFALLGALGAYLTWRWMGPAPPSAGKFARACRREFRYLVDDYGFAAEPLMSAGIRDPFGCRFQGAKFAVIVQGIQWGYAVHVYLDTGNPEAEWAAELERLRSTNPEEETAEASTKRFNEIRMRSQLPAHWLLDQRLPGWRLTENDQLAQIHEYAAALRSCAADLFRGDLSALPELFASYAEHRRQQDRHDQQEVAILFAKEVERSRTVPEQEIILQGIHHSISYLRTECRILLKALSKSPEASSLLRFVESWQALAECLKSETVRLTSVQGLEAFPRIMEGLRNAEEAATLVGTVIASGHADHFLTERVAALDHQGKELLVALEGLSRGVEGAGPGDLRLAAGLRRACRIHQ